MTPTHHDDWAYAGELHDVSIELTERGSDVVVRIEPPFCGGLCPPPERCSSTTYAWSDDYWTQ